MPDSAKEIQMRFKPAIILILLLPLLAATRLCGQPVKDTIFPNSVKVNVVASYFRNLSFFYERWLNDRWSLQLGVGYKITGRIPKVIGLESMVVASESGGISGFSFAPEVRYHFRQCECDRRAGLYAGIYGKFTRLYGDLSFNYWDGSRYIDVGGAGNMNEFGFGFQLGYQFTFKKHFLVDLFFMGPRTSFQRLTMKVDSKFATEVIPQIEEELNKRLEWFGLDPVEIPVSSEFTVNFRFNNFRYGVGIGYLF